MKQIIRVLTSYLIQRNYFIAETKPDNRAFYNCSINERSFLMHLLKIITFQHI
jgi:hypothetical protein